LISFRNHVVTLVSVFLALAVGVALGGGPLSEVGRGTLSSATAPGQVEQGPSDREEYGDAFALAAAPRLYAGALDAHPVAVLTMPGADQGVTKALVAEVERAAGSVAATYEARRALVDPSEKSLVDTLGSQLVAQVGKDVADPGAPTYERIGQLLGSAVATRSARGAGLDGPTGSIRQSLAGAEMVAGPSGEPERAALVLVVLGDDVDDDVLAGILAGLAERSVGVVAVAAAGGSASKDLGGLRTSPLASDVATVDGVDSGVGRVTATLALVRSLEETGGSFGAAGADGAVPLW
jgi:hypothetical protein